MHATRLAYRPALDGLRAIAVLAVMLYHAQVGWLPGGFLGVDVFFVLSGYLITSLLIRETRAWGSIDLLGFWLRRARRLLPALFLVLCAVAVYGAYFVATDRLARLRGDALATLLYVANWRFASTGAVILRSVPGALAAAAHVVARHRGTVLLAVPALLDRLAPGGGLEQRSDLVFIVAAASSAFLMAALYVPGAIRPASITAPTPTLSHCWSARLLP